MSTTAPSVGLHRRCCSRVYRGGHAREPRVREDLLHFSFHGVIDAKRDGGTTGRTDHLGGLVYGFRSIVRRAVTTHTSSSAINRSTRLSERSRNASPCTARRASYDRY